MPLGEHKPNRQLHECSVEAQCYAPNTLRTEGTAAHNCKCVCKPGGWGIRCRFPFAVDHYYDNTPPMFGVGASVAVHHLPDTDNKRPSTDHDRFVAYRSEYFAGCRAMGISVEEAEAICRNPSLGGGGRAAADVKGFHLATFPTNAALGLVTPLLTKLRAKDSAYVGASARVVSGRSHKAAIMNMSWDVGRLAGRTTWLSKFHGAKGTGSCARITFPAPSWDPIPSALPAVDAAKNATGAIVTEGDRSSDLSQLTATFDFCKMAPTEPTYEQPLEQCATIFDSDNFFGNVHCDGNPGMKCFLCERNPCRIGLDCHPEYTTQFAVGGEYFPNCKCQCAADAAEQIGKRFGEDYTVNPATCAPVRRAVPVLPPTSTATSYHPLTGGDHVDNNAMPRTFKFFNPSTGAEVTFPVPPVSLQVFALAVVIALCWAVRCFCGKRKRSKRKSRAAHSRMAV